MKRRNLYVAVLAAPLTLLVPRTARTIEKTLKKLPPEPTKSYSNLSIGTPTDCWLEIRSQQSKYECSKHGITSSCLTIAMPNRKITFCMECWMDHIVQNMTCIEDEK